MQDNNQNYYLNMCRVTIEVRPKGIEKVIESC